MSSNPLHVYCPFNGEWRREGAGTEGDKIMCPIYPPVRKNSGLVLPYF